MGNGTEVMLIPADKTHTGLYQLSRTMPSGMPGGWAAADGTFVERWRSRDGIGFRSAEEAIAWAEAPPRYWRVVNKMMFGPQAIKMPHRMTIKVTGCIVHPMPHETVTRRQQAGEEVIQIVVKFDALDVQTPLAGCFVILDQPAIALLAQHNIQTPSELVNHTIVVESDDTDDIERPLRLIQVVY